MTSTSVRFNRSNRSNAAVRTVRTIHTKLRLVDRSESFDQFRLLVHEQIPDSYADRGGRLDLDRSERQRYDCPDHGTVVPLNSSSYSCPYCTPIGEYELSCMNYMSWSVTIGGQVTLNAS